MFFWVPFRRVHPGRPSQLCPDQHPDPIALASADQQSELRSDPRALRPADPGPDGHADLAADPAANPGPDHLPVRDAVGPSDQPADCPPLDRAVHVTLAFTDHTADREPVGIAVGVAVAFAVDVAVGAAVFVSDGAAVAPWICRCQQQRRRWR